MRRLERRIKLWLRYELSLKCLELPPNCSQITIWYEILLSHAKTTIETWNRKKQFLSLEIGEHDAADNNLISSFNSFDFESSGVVVLCWPVLGHTARGRGSLSGTIQHIGQNAIELLLQWKRNRHQRGACISDRKCNSTRPIQHLDMDGFFGNHNSDAQSLLWNVRLNI